MDNELPDTAEAMEREGDGPRRSRSAGSSSSSASSPSGAWYLYAYSPWLTGWTQEGELQDAQAGGGFGANIGMHHRSSRPSPPRRSVVALVHAAPAEEASEAPMTRRRPPTSSSGHALRGRSSASRIFLYSQKRRDQVEEPKYKMLDDDG